MNQSAKLFALAQDYAQQVALKHLHLDGWRPVATYKPALGSDWQWHERQHELEQEPKAEDTHGAESSMKMAPRNWYVASFLFPNLSDGDRAAIVELMFHRDNCHFYGKHEQSDERDHGCFMEIRRTIESGAFTRSLTADQVAVLDWLISEYKPPGGRI